MRAVRLGNLEFDRDRFAVRIEWRTVELTFTEFALLDELVRNAGRVVLREHLLGVVWGDESGKASGRLRVQMSRLRKKLQGSWPWTIRTFKKRGYALIDSSEQQQGARLLLGRPQSGRLEPSRRR
jgi:DNA-binding response OmpR family regulator